jgi:predicted O-methyltransferase YrrM
LEFEDIASYLAEIKRVLKPGGRAAIQYATISSEDGWKYFQNNCRLWRENSRARGRFCELTLDTVKLLADRLGLSVVVNECLGRDAMLVVENPSDKQTPNGKTSHEKDQPRSRTSHSSALLNLLHSKSPYADFPLHEYRQDLQGWHSQHPLMAELIAQQQPELVIEVGSWKGGSAIHMAGLLKANRIRGQLVCVDTWLGALEFWLDHSDSSRYQALAHRFGYPTVYYQFLANVLQNKLEDIIVPFPQTSLIAARWFAHQGLKADLIYVDASHDEPDVAADLEAYWPVVKDGGVIFGDDYDQYWPGLVKAVQAFAAEHSLAVREQQGFWMLQKPRTTAPAVRDMPELLAVAAE